MPVNQTHAETLLWGGRPEFGLELEQEKTPDKLGVTHSITYIPSLSFPDGPVNRFDLLIMDERGLLGHYSSSAERFVYGYTDAAIRYEQGFWGFIAGVRVQRSLDGSKGHDRNKFRLGPSFDIGDHHELEFRWIRAWDAHTHVHESDATILEYTYKF